MKFKRKATGSALSRAVLLLVLLLPGAVALSQDSFFYIDDVSRDGTGTSSWSGLGMSGNGLGMSGDGTWDGFGFNGDGLGMSGDGMWGEFGFEGDGSENEASWEGFEYGNPLPTGSGLLALTVSGLFYAGMKRRKDSKI